MTGKFRVGQIVEVRIDDQDVESAWYAAEIIEIQRKSRKLKVSGRILVLSENLPKEAGENGVVEVAVSNIRPKPPDDKKPCFRLNEEVNLYFNKGWWKGEITDVLEDSMFMVYVSVWGENLHVEGRRLRLHLDWIGGKWVPPDDMRKQHDKPMVIASRDNKEIYQVIPLSQRKGRLKAKSKCTVFSCNGKELLELKSCQKENITHCPSSEPEELLHNCSTQEKIVSAVKPPSEDTISELSKKRPGEQISSDSPKRGKELLELKSCQKEKNGHCQPCELKELLYNCSTQEKIVSAMKTPSEDTISELSKRSPGEQTSAASPKRGKEFVELKSCQKEKLSHCHLSEPKELFLIQEKMVRALIPPSEDTIRELGKRRPGEQISAESPKGGRLESKAKGKELSELKCSEKEKISYYRQSEPKELLISCSTQEKIVSAMKPPLVDTISEQSKRKPGEQTSAESPKRGRLVSSAEGKECTELEESISHVRSSEQKELLCKSSTQENILSATKTLPEDTISEQRNKRSGEQISADSPKRGKLESSVEGLENNFKCNKQPPPQRGDKGLSLLISSNFSSQESSCITNKAKALEDNLYAELGSRKSSDSLESLQVLPFEKSLFWKVMEEEMDIIKLFPLNPHFRPLEKCPMYRREGLAIGLVKTFSVAVEKTRQARPDTPRRVFEDILENLDELELHGFDVHKVRTCIDGILKKKHSRIHLEKQLESAEREILEVKAEIGKYEEDMENVSKNVMEATNLLRDVEDDYTRLMGQQKFIKIKMVEGKSIITDLQRNLDLMEQNIQQIEADFREIAISV